MCVDFVGMVCVFFSLMLPQAMPNNAQREPFQPLIPAMLDTVAQALNANEEETAQDAVELLIEVCCVGGCMHARVHACRRVNQP